MKLSTQPYKGARDFFPEDMRVRNYIFETWRKVARRFGFEEYDFPIVENFEVFASKSGEEIVNTQLFSFEDKGGRKVALRPELTPSTVRMIADRINEIPKPVKWFMIGNNWRFEKPQKGRGREFYQLESNIFGVPGVEADLEIMLLIIAIMREFGATKEMFVVNISDRRLIMALLQDTLQLDAEKQVAVRRLMDKRNKMEKEDFFSALSDIGLTLEQADKVEAFMKSDLSTLTDFMDKQMLEQNEGYVGIMKLFEMLKQNDVAQFCKFDPSIIRGFDYSDGLVYEVFDTNPENRRSMFGGERFDRLVQIYGNMELAASGFAMGDITLLEFLKGWNLVPTTPILTDVLVTIFNGDFNRSIKIAQELRSQGLNVDMYVQDDKLEKQLKYADKKGINWIVIPGDEEIAQGKVTLKNFGQKTQEVVEIQNVIKKVRA